MTKGWQRGPAITAVLVLLYAGSHSQAAADERSNLPKIELDDRLRQIFSVNGCEYVSGLTCRIHYNGKAPLPSEVFFTELDAKGQRLGRRTRLIYPHLTRGESGAATFRLRSSSPARIRLEASGDGPWKDPY